MHWFQMLTSSSALIQMLTSSRSTLTGTQNSVWLNVWYLVVQSSWHTKWTITFALWDTSPFTSPTFCLLPFLGLCRWLPLYVSGPQRSVWGIFPFSLLSLGDFILSYDPSNHLYTFVLLARSHLWALSSMLRSLEVLISHIMLSIPEQ